MSESRIFSVPRDSGRQAITSDPGPLAAIISQFSIIDINRGTRSGATTLGPEDDIYDNSRGTHTGWVHAGGGDDVLVGGTGTDNLFGQDGADVIIGGGGDDFIDGGAGPDNLDGGAGFDTVSYLTSRTAVVLDLATGSTTGAGTDRIAGFERVLGSRFGDQLTGSGTADTLEGRDGDDTLNGADGADTLIGGTGSDSLTGGAGDDRFVFSTGDGADVVTDFQAGQDKLVIHGYTAWQELRQVGADTLVVLSSGDTILLRGVSAGALSTSDFIFSATPLVVPESPPAPADDLPPSRISTTDVFVYAGQVETDRIQLMYDQGRVGANGFYTPSLYNAGTVTATEGPVLGINQGDFHRAWIVNLATGVVSVTSGLVNSGASGIGSFSGGANTYNAGTIALNVQGDAIGMASGSVYGHIAAVNTGSITVSGGHATGIYAANQTAVFNSGVINVTGTLTARGVRVDDQADSFVNTGQIIAGPAQFASIGLAFSTGRGPSNFFNDGLIEGTFAVSEGAGATGYPDPNPIDHFYNTGELRGNVSFTADRDELYNTGRITGLTTLGDGDDLYDGRGGVQLGGVHGGADHDTLLGGIGADHLFGDDGNDILSGSDGADVLTGGAGTDIFHFTAGDGRDTIVDFNAAANERIRVTGYTTWQSVQQIGDDVLVVLSASDSILLLGVQVATVTADLFQFSAPAIAAAAAPPARPVAPSHPVPSAVGGAAVPPVLGGLSSDSLVGTGGADLVHGLHGDDFLTGGLGNDGLLGGAGSDTFVYGLGDGNDTIYDFTRSEGDVIRLNGVLSTNYSIQQIVNNTIITFSDGGTLTIAGATRSDVEAAIQLGSPPGYRVEEGGTGADDLIGSDVADLLRGNGGADRLRGMGGNDLIEGGSGDDRIEGGAGNDQLTGGAGADTFIIRPGEGHDVITDFNPAEGDILMLEGFPFYGSPSSHSNMLIFGGGSYSISLNGISNAPSVWGSIRIGPAEPTAPALTGTDAGERIIGTAQAERITGRAGGDIIIAGTGSDIIDAGSGNDTISGDAGLDLITGGSGADTFLFRPGSHNDIITDFNPAEGDQLRLEGYRSYSIHDHGAYILITVMQDFTGEEGTITLMNTTRAAAEAGIVLVPDEVPLPNLERDLYGTAGNDTLIGDGRNDAILGGAGNDRIEGRDGRDLVEGGDGNDTVDGGAGDDLINGGRGTDTLTGGAGRDWFAFYAGDGTDRITDFNPNEDVIDVGFEPIALIAQSGSDCRITLQSGDVLTLTGIQAHMLGARNFVRTLSTPPLVPSPISDVQTGTAGADVLTGTSGADTLLGLAGNDQLFGGDGNDVLDGGIGNDILDGGAGIDRLTGGTGDDTFYANSASDLVFENVGEGTDTVIASAGFYLYANIENLTLATGAGDIFGVGNDLANVITGNAGGNLLIAGGGIDTVNGGLGNDAIYGQDGADVLNGEAGIDYLVGGIGNDVIDGGEDADNLFGEDGNDTLIGGTGFVTDIMTGGAGNDILRGDSTLGDYDLMDGGADNDSYYVDTGDDLTFEAVGGGIDTVYADVRVTNGGVYLYANVENLVLIGTTAFGVGNELDNLLTGNASGNYLLGGAGADTINGGAGNDVLFGEGGNDVFAFSVGSGGDVIGDFQLAGDRMDVSAFFTSFAQVQANFSQVGGDGAINLGNGDFIVLHGVTMANLTAGHFIFGGAGAPVEAEGKDGDGREVLPGLMDDGFIPGLKGDDDGREVLPGAADREGFDLFDLDGIVGDRVWTGLEHRLATLFLETAEEGPELDPGIDNGAPGLHHNPDPWAG